jgi:hypothetical protein
MVAVIMLCTFAFFCILLCLDACNAPDTFIPWDEEVVLASITAMAESEGIEHTVYYA